VSAGRGCLDGCWRDANGGVRPCRRVVQRANADTAAEAERKSERSSTTEYRDNFLGSSHRTLPFNFMLSISKPYTCATVATRHTAPVLAGCGVFLFSGDGTAFDLDGRADVVASAPSVGAKGTLDRALRPVNVPHWPPTPLQRSGHEYAHGSDRVIAASRIARWNKHHGAVTATRTALLRNVRATKQFHGPLGATGYFSLVINFRRATLSGLSSSAMCGWSTSATMISPTS
jgi:hypothetical protein